MRKRTCFIAIKAKGGELKEKMNALVGKDRDRRLLGVFLCRVGSVLDLEKTAVTLQDNAGSSSDEWPRRNYTLRSDSAPNSVQREGKEHKEEEKPRHEAALLLPGERNKRSYLSLK